MRVHSVPGPPWEAGLWNRHDMLLPSRAFSSCDHSQGTHIRVINFLPWMGDRWTIETDAAEGCWGSYDTPLLPEELQTPNS